MSGQPPEEAGPLRELLVARGVDLIFLTAPTTTESRLDKICAAASGLPASTNDEAA